MEATDQVGRHPVSDPCHETSRIQSLLQSIAARAQSDAGRTADPEARSLLYATVQVLRGLVRAHEQYEHEQERAFARDRS